MYTKSTNEIWVDDDFFDKLAKKQCKNKITEAADKLNEYAEKLNEELYNINSDWVKLEGKDVYYIHKHRILIPDITSFKCSIVNDSGFNNMFDDLEGRIISEDEAYDLFFLSRSSNPLFVDNVWFTNGGDNHCVVRYKTKNDEGYECLNSHGNRSCCYKSLYNNCKNCSWGYGVKIPVYELRHNSAMENFIVFRLVPEDISADNKAFLNVLTELYAAEYIDIKNNLLYFTEKFENDVLEDKINEIFGINFEISSFTNDLKEYTLNSIVPIEDDFKKSYIKKILCGDKVRAEIEEYDEKRLSDPNQGMWELWQDEGNSGNQVKIKTDLNLVARNPVADIKEDGIVGIDFGTKSTIVVYQNGNDRIMPMRIGIGTMSAQIKPEQYENPTVMEIKNLENFIRAYNKRDGRPETEWADITISHTAYKNMTSSNISDDFYSYFYDLKQWCADTDKNHIVTIKDQCDNEYQLAPYNSDNQNKFDPIEIYAYYLGLYINNIRNGIYLEYLLSFPITYEKELKEKILNSFYKGIKKSLPVSVQEDENCMDIFSVKNGVSEPVAYAITAFDEFGIKPKDSEEFIYGVFDFGGGTTDFSFGTYKRADNTEKKKFDYVVTHISSGGDRYLGGENLLELLAYEIFKANYSRLLRRDDKYDFKGIEFTIPHGCDYFLGSETLISDSQKAKRNTKQLMEKLRPYWENIGGSYLSAANYPVDEKAEEVIRQIEKGYIKVDLFDNSGNLLKDFMLDIYNENLGIFINLNEILEQRIEQGVRQFFILLKNTFSLKKIKESKGMEIFLAGNSGKCPVLKKLFYKYTDMYSHTTNETPVFELFRIYPSLGTDEAAIIQSQNGIGTIPGDLSAPTGKTGVAYGLIKGRVGSRIKVISPNTENDEIIFNYYLGHSEDGLFICDISRESVHDKEWIQYTEADVSRIELYYSDLPEAAENKMPIQKTLKKIIRIKKPDDSAFLYIRVSSQSSVEYVIARSSEIAAGKYLSEINKLEF
ncbi:MAG: molecular chaperone DnaK [Ruminococcus sp.]|nr:molecular chaperone DnaK [Ruminococcus sp.]